MSSRTRASLSKMVSSVSNSFSGIGLLLNKEKCEFLSFASTSSSPLNCDTFSIPSVDSLQWLGISLTNNLSGFRQRTVYDISKSIRFGYGKIVPNRGEYTRRVLEKLYSTYCNQSVLYTAGIYHILRKIDLKRIRSSYFRYCEFLLFIPPWTHNRILIGKYGVPDITLKLGKLHKKLSGTALNGLSQHNHLENFFL